MRDMMILEESDVSDRELLRACERTLFRAARRHYRGPRAVLRGLVRRRVRAHKRDRAWLQAAIRGAVASGVFALALLGLGVGSARADATLFLEETTANPFAAIANAPASQPALGDLDGDGDLDVIVAGLSGSFLYYENMGSAEIAAYVEQVGANNPLDGINPGTEPAPALGDLDGDGDLDLVLGALDGTFRYLENTGTVVAPAFTQQTGASNPLDTFDIGDHSKPTLGDLDGDGDLDLVAGEALGEFAYFQNVGTALMPAFVRQLGSANPLDGADVGHRAGPSLGDFDGDGDLDLVAGESSGSAGTIGQLFFYENQGTPTAAVFVNLPGAANPLADAATTDIRPTTSVGDIDGDGDLDLVVGSFAGSLQLFENRKGTFAERVGAADPLDGQTPGSGPATLGDLDGDGDLDLISGDAPGTFKYFRNTGSGTNPVFTEQVGVSNPLDGADVGDDSAPTLGDLDGDGDLDLISGELDGEFRYYRNTGSSTNPVFALQTGAANPLDGADVGGDSSPTLGDLDRDGDLDLIVGTSAGTFLYFENTGSSTSPVFVLQTGAANPLDGEDVGDDSAPTLGDVDGDGDLDLIAGAYNGTFFFYRNTGNDTSPVFALQTGAANPLDGVSFGLDSTSTLGDLDGDGDLDLVAQLAGLFYYFENSLIDGGLQALELAGAANPLDGQDVGFNSTSTLGDLDGDGDLDLVAGEVYGEFLYYRNTGSATSPAFALQTGTSNPLDGQDVGDYSAPTLGDLDGDGDLDLVAGAYDGRLFYFQNTGNATSPAFVQQTGAANPLDGEDLGVDSSATLGDLDGDGDLDLIAGELLGELLYYRNTGSATSPAFALQTGASNPLDGEDVGFRSRPTLGDVDADGDLDLVVGEYDGELFFYLNTGSATNPVFVEQVGAADPLDGEDVGFGASPTLGDLDGDGDLNLVSGELFGMFRTFHLPEPALSWLLAAGAGLLGWLKRGRSGLD